MKRYSAFVLAFSGLVFAAGVSAQTPGQRMELTGGGETIVMEPYAPNILRVTLSMDDAAAKAAPGYGIIAAPDAAGWTVSETDGQDVYKSDRMIVVVQHPRGKPGPPFGTTGTSVFFRGSAPWAHITFWTPDGKKLLEMNGWEQADYNHKDGTAQLANDFRASDPKSFVMGATFASPDDEHYYGLG